MIAEAESWNESGGIGQVGCKHLSMTAETQEEAVWLAGISALFFAEMGRGKNFQGTIETVDEGTMSASEFINKQRAK